MSRPRDCRFELPNARCSFFPFVFFLVSLLFLFTVMPHNIMEPVHAGDSSSWMLETTLDRAESRVKGVDFSSGSEYVAYMEDNGQVYVHRVGNGWPLVQVFHEPDVHRAGDVEFSHDGELLVYGFLNEKRNSILQAVKVDGWKKSTRKEHSSQSGRSAGVPADLQFTSSGRWLVSGTNSNHCYVWDVDNDFKAEKIFNPSRFAQNPTGIAIGDSGDYVLVTASQGTPDVYEVGTWERVTTLRNVTRSSAPAINKNNSMVFSDKSNRLWVYEKGEDWSEVAEFEAEGSIGRSRFSNTDHWLVFGDNEGRLGVVDSRNWVKRGIVKEAGEGITGISFSGDDEYLAYSSNDGNVYIHDVPDYSTAPKRLRDPVVLDEVAEADISELILTKDGDVSTLTIKYGADSTVDVSYGSEYSLVVEDTPGGKVKFKIEDGTQN